MNKGMLFIIGVLIVHYCYFIIIFFNNSQRKTQAERMKKYRQHKKENKMHSSGNASNSHYEQRYVIY